MKLEIENRALDAILYVRVEQKVVDEIQKRAAKKKVKIRTYIRSLIKHALEVTK